MGTSGTFDLVVVSGDVAGKKQNRHWKNQSSHDGNLIALIDLDPTVLHVCCLGNISFSNMSHDLKCL